MAEERQILIAGAGIGGLCAGIALERAGFRVRVFERASELLAAGAGITVQANAMMALRRLALDAAVLAEGRAITLTRIATARGRVLASTQLDRLEREIGAPSVAIHRARLQRVLLDALGRDRVELGAEVTAVVHEANGVSITLADGRSAVGELLVGADGLHSSIRAQLHGAAPPDYAGYTSWRGVAANVAAAPGHAGEMWGRGARFGHVDIGHGEVYWFGVLDSPPAGRDTAGCVRAELLHHFAEFAEPALALIQGTDEAAIVRTDIGDRPALPRWGRGRVTLLGDAAHPMTPNLGQGGCQAIEDAVALGECLAGAADSVAALRAYENRRAARAEWFVAQSRQMGRIAQASVPAAVWLRDAALRLVPRRALERRIVAAQRYPV